MIADIAVIGGSGLYSLIEGEGAPHDLDTPYGTPSDPIVVGKVAGRTVAFLPRHGTDHRYPPHKIPYRANLWALRELGVRQILAPCAVGGLRPDHGPGTFVLPDQVVDRTTSRVGTFFDEGAHHTSFGDPYCPAGRRAVLDSAEVDIVDGGTMVVIEGPRFSTRAESQWYAAQGASIINMTGMPEAILARELGLCYTSIALVTDHDAGVVAGEAVTMEEVFRVFAENTERMKSLVLRTVAALPPEHSCA
ncbi:purine nucleoside phosphorylase [Longispora fulva]|uniref:S-methyl-5'-thioadenosine phosphorylase n=1 Tax=Longispora fulva TaxID=619741 RepID=A0A8J7KZ82_9ACTN|nr:S-methyl-5'-thioadenosine phosphorylase [Longispora fulva]MBG6140432.1 5'-methylthioadenosine phosphorylase [Longispora fulva]GIG57187.1 purine nucleoside phosphorylase [Longispora fulva]